MEYTEEPRSLPDLLYMANRPRCITRPAAIDPPARFTPRTIATPPEIHLRIGHSDESLNLCAIGRVCWQREVIEKC